MYESKKQYHYGTGRRKSSIARVRVYENGTGSIIINGREIDDYFGLDTLKLIVRQPLVTTDLLGKVDVVCTVQGGGVTGQAGAIRHGISRALLGLNSYEYYEKDKVRRYGFHGTSHKYVSGRAAAMLGKKPEELKLISCHLGNGSSIAAVDGGKSVDTSMGFTPLAGLPMGTRSGDLDAGILQYLMNKYGMNIDEMLNILNKKSGVEGLSGVSSDFRDLEKAAEEGNARAQLAEEKFAYEVKKYVGAYAAAMGGVDAIIFTAGVGENDKGIRAMVCDGLEYMGVKLDPAANDVRGKETVISAADSKVKVLLIPTNEELMIATDTAAIVKGN